MTTITPQSGFDTRRLDIGRVGQELFGLIQKDPVGTYGLAAGLTAIPAVLSLILTVAGLNVGAATGPAAFGRMQAMGPWFILTALVGLVISVLTYGALGWGAVESVEGRTPSIGEKLSAAGAALLPMIGVAILGYIGIVIASILLVVPGVILATVWSVVMVVAVVDRAGVFGSFSRSAALTKNSRWMIFLLLLIYMVAAMLFAVLNVIFVRIGMAGGLIAGTLISAVLQILVGGLINTVGAVGTGVVYQELRTLKGEFDPGRLNRVFS